ncbi:MAG: HsdM family class I SAM-dependent methyltransferase, partial [Dehalococcoidia bacterium]
AYRHLEKQCRTVEDRRKLQDRSIVGGEAKTLPFMLCQMNLLLHGLESPRIDPGNSLRFKLSEIGDRDRVDVILTNPPFCGEEEKGIQGNFPADMQTSETALLFLQLIMRRLRRAGRGGRDAGFGTRDAADGFDIAGSDARNSEPSTRYPSVGRAAVVVPNGTLFGDGAGARIKEELLRGFNLHTIVRLPDGVFAPYTSIPTNLLFFDRSGPTREVWYYEQPLPAGRKNYTKTAPIQVEDFAGCLAWWHDRQENDHAWRVPAEQILANNRNLDIKNPNAAKDLEHLPPEELAASILQKEARITELMEKIRQVLAGAEG